MDQSTEPTIETTETTLSTNEPNFDLLSTLLPEEIEQTEVMDFTPQISDIQRQLIETRARRMRLAQEIETLGGDEYLAIDNDESMSMQSESASVVRSEQLSIAGKTNGRLEKIDDEESTEELRIKLLEDQAKRRAALISPVRQPSPFLPVPNASEPRFVVDEEDWDNSTEVQSYQPQRRLDENNRRSQNEGAAASSGQSQGAIRKRPRDHSRRQFTADDHVSIYLERPRSPSPLGPENLIRRREDSPWCPLNRSSNNSNQLSFQINNNSNRLSRQTRENHINNNSNRLSRQTRENHSSSQPMENRSFRQTYNSTGDSNHLSSRNNNNSNCLSRQTNETQRSTSNRSRSQNNRNCTLDIRRRPITQGVRYSNLEIIETDPSIDPPQRCCFNCWQKGHKAVNCNLPKQGLYCTNCGRKGRVITTCERCKKAYAEAQRERSETASSESSRSGNEPKRPREESWDLQYRYPLPTGVHARLGPRPVQDNLTLTVNNTVNQSSTPVSQNNNLNIQSEPQNLALNPTDSVEVRENRVLELLRRLESVDEETRIRVLKTVYKKEDEKPKK